jgi:hypothetical protein
MVLTHEQFMKEVMDSLSENVLRQDTHDTVNIFHIKEGVSDGNIYDWSQCYEPINDGDLFVLPDGRVVLMLEAWPTMIRGKSKVLHRFKDDNDNWGADYPKSKAAFDSIVDSLPAIDPNQVFPDESPKDYEY